MEGFTQTAASDTAQLAVYNIQHRTAEQLKDHIYDNVQRIIAADEE